VCEFDDVCASVVAFAQVWPVRGNQLRLVGRSNRAARPLTQSRSRVFFGALPVRSIFTVLLLMPRYFFDLFFDRYVVLDPDGMLVDRKAGARGAAREMARHLAAVRPELRDGRGWIRVRDIKRNEVHRLAIDPEVRPDVPAQRRTVTLIAAE
jgi:hypothetical protein